MSAKSDLNRIFSDIVGAVDDLRRSYRLRELSKFTIDLIQKRVWSGRGVKKFGGNTHRLKALSPSYIKFRNRYRRKLDPMTSPSTSNLTFTGQMIRSMKQKIRSQKDRVTITIGPQGPRKDGKKNETVALYVSTARPFMALSGGEQRAVVQYYTNVFEKNLKSKKLI